MSMTEPSQGTRTTGVRGRTTDTFGRRAMWSETKPFAMTSEFWVTVFGIAAVLLVGYFSDNATLTVFRAWLLATIMGAAYIVSRGMAKSGSRSGYDESMRA